MELSCIVQSHMAIIDSPLVFMRLLATTHTTHHNLTLLLQRWGVVMEKATALVGGMKGYLSGGSGGSGSSSVSSLELGMRRRKVEAEVRRLKGEVEVEKEVGRRKEEVMYSRVNSSSYLSHYRQQLRLATLHHRLTTTTIRVATTTLAQQEADKREDELIRGASDDVMAIRLEGDMVMMRKEMETDSITGTLEIEQGAYYERLNEEVSSSSSSSSGSSDDSWRRRRRRRSKGHTP